MCEETIDVVGLDNQRTAYEVEQYLLGLPYVSDATADFISDTVFVEYDESDISHERILDELEHSGCTPSDRINGFFDKLKVRMGRSV
jgi:cation transport ATPase